LRTLYDFIADPGERTSRAATRPQELQRGRALLTAADAAVERTRISLRLPAPTTRKVERIIRGVGYIQ